MRCRGAALLAALDGHCWFMALLLDGAGLRLREVLRPRVKDIDFARNEIMVREGKGNKDRVTILPGSVKEPLGAYLARVEILHQRDLAAGFGRMSMPDALARTYLNAVRDWGWQWVFPASRIYRDPRWGDPQRFHIHKSVLQKAIRAAALQAAITMPTGLAHYATASPPTCSPPATTSVPSRRSSATKTSARR